MTAQFRRGEECDEQRIPPQRIRTGRSLEIVLPQLNAPTRAQLPGHETDGGRPFAGPRLELEIRNHISRKSSNVFTLPRAAGAAPDDPSDVMYLSLNAMRRISCVVSSGHSGSGRLPSRFVHVVGAVAHIGRARESSVFFATLAACSADACQALDRPSCAGIFSGQTNRLFCRSIATARMCGTISGLQFGPELGVDQEDFFAIFFQCQQWAFGDRVCRRDALGRTIADEAFEQGS